MFQRTLAIALAVVGCFAATARGEVRAEIDGPDFAKAGRAVILTAGESVAANVRWISPQGLQFISCNPREIFFFPPDPGIYRFYLVAADTEANIDYAEKVVTVTESGKPEPLPDPEPDKPPPRPSPPANEVERTKRVSRDAATRLADPITANALAAAIQAQSDAINDLCKQRLCPTVPTAKSMMVQQITNTLAKRSGASQGVSWKDWRTALNNQLAAADSSTLDKYLTLMRAAAVGLIESATP